ALALDLHPVRADAPAVAARLDLAGELDGAAEEQQLLGQRRLAGVGMRDDGEGAPARDLAGEARNLPVPGRGLAQRSLKMQQRRRMRQRAPVHMGSAGEAVHGARETAGTGMLTLYFAPGSSSMAPHIALHEIGVPFESRPLSFAEAEQRAPWYRAIN